MGSLRGRSLLGGRVLALGADDLGLVDFPGTRGEGGRVEGQDRAGFEDLEQDLLHISLMRVAGVELDGDEAFEGAALLVVVDEDRSRLAVDLVLEAVAAGDDRELVVLGEEYSTNTGLGS